MKVVKNELGVRVEFREEVLLDVISNKRELSGAYHITWFSIEDWNVLRPLLLLLQEYYLIQIGKHKKLTLRSTKDGESTKKFYKDKLGTQIEVYSQRRKRNSSMLDTKLTETIWISIDDFDGLSVTRNNTRDSIIFHLNTWFNIKRGNHSGLRLVKKK